MSLGLGWKLKDADEVAAGGVVAPDERLGWGKTVGLGAQHVVAMFGATFVFPLIMGLNAQLAIMMSGIATIIFLLIVQGKVPSYLGTSASFVGGVAAIRANGGDSKEVTGAILIAGIVLAIVGVIIHFAGSGFLHKALPPVVTGAVVMLIGFNLAPVVANIYWPQDQWVALLTMLFTIIVAVAFRGFIGRISVFLALIFGTLLSWILDKTAGPITSVLGGATEATEHLRWNTAGIGEASWFGFPPATTIAADGKEAVGWHFPTFSMAAILLVLPAVIALIAENTGHVKAVAEMTGHDLNPVMGKAIAGDGVGTAVASLFGGSPTTTYAENIGVMAATRVYSTAAYYVAALVALLFGLSPKFGALVSSVPGGVLGGITVVLYGMIGLLGAKIWKENGVDFANPINLVPVAAGIVIGIGDVKMKFSDSFTLSGIALGTIVAILAYHLAKAVAHKDLRDRADGTAIAVGDYTYGDSDGVDDLYQDGDPAAREREAGRRHNPGGPDSGRHRL
ncbi:MAG: nitrate reductase [Tetrasphaera sp.]|jgi:uracil-xanthine permease|uniref:uracil-xanthine permease family protein n=2 Tax=Intrasporangiaceae TaxID=85021 RepID=UPI001D8EA442|nr:MULTISPECIES: solute carrier family 23 protein [Phycicoccus]MBK8728524.1 nitrate reductase [Tetrasphaera sp.]MCB1240056.1 nitrate reductase [Tetrasphaera sp.]HPQ74133.1 solute carrier family 23 protein [Phycicoccus elongatus]HRV58502.1 solute carrier family 23 protein [Phycicoccus sp.]